MAGLQSVDRLLRASTVEAFHETISYCFNKVLQEMLGGPVRDELFNLLERSSIHRTDVPVRFNDVIRLLTRAFGASARILIYRTVVELYQEYSQRPDFSYEDELNYQIELLKTKVLADLIRPRHLFTTSIDSYFVPGPLVHE